MPEPVLVSSNRLFSDLDQLTSLPSSAGSSDELIAVATRIATMMRTYGLEVTTITTTGAPIVVGRQSGEHPFTLLLYHHYDTAPPGPWRLWHHHPFQLAERDGQLYGRGIADGKGPLVSHLNALASLLESRGQLPCGVVVVAEGEGLIGSPNLQMAINKHRSLLSAHACLSIGGERDPQGRPFCYSGTKGLIQMRLRVDGATASLPSGLAASVPNPLWRLIWALGHIKSEQEEVLIGGFYDDMEVPSRAVNQTLRSTAVDEQGRLTAWGIKQFLFTMGGSALVQAETTMPTCNIASLTVEPSTDLAVIPTSASARIEFQLVPAQRPDVIADLLRAHLQSKGLDDIAIERLPGSYSAIHTPFEHPFVQQVSTLGQQIYDGSLTLLPQGPFAQPLSLFAELLGIPVSVVGCARPDSAIAAPNEHLPFDDLVRQGHFLAELLDACPHNTALRG